LLDIVTIFITNLPGEESIGFTQLPRTPGPATKLFVSVW